MNGVIMQRVIGYAIATIAFSSIGGVPVVASGAGGIDGQNVDQRAAWRANRCCRPAHALLAARRQ